MKPLRIGVVGVGHLGQFHAEKYARMEGVELVGIADIIADRAHDVASRLGTKAFTDYKDLIEKVDAASIVVPTDLHFPASHDFLEAKVDLLIEKPITETLDDADTLIQLADSKGLIIQVGHLERFNPAILALSEVIDRPLFIESDRLSGFGERGTEVDVVLDLMIHDIDIILSLVKSPIKSIHAVGVPVVTPRVDIANARLIFENGCVANVTASRISMKSMRKIRFFQRDTYVSVDYASHDVTIIQKDGKGTKLPVPGMSMNRSKFENADSLDAELKAFVQSVRTRQPPLVTGSDGRNALQVAIDIVRQIETSTREVLAGQDK
ncbi:MAG: UDP-N-acetyl-D-glucosamine dehydrogenase [Desulfobacterales bacterium S7086C20]|nr:MAG: UDP-N-acetyl-D-glucosamine dehydrogenase [Desulfobacterales bacterium S7086C20]